MKREMHYRPATIRKKVGALARCCDWGIRKKLLLLPDMPFRTLPEGYAQYTELDAKLAGVGRPTRNGTAGLSLARKRGFGRC